jgi:hypothetical protein
MSKKWEPRRKTVELRPSRIRREPAPADKPLSLVGKVDWNSREWEIRLALIGMVLFALALSAAVIDIGELLSY